MSITTKTSAKGAGDLSRFGKYRAGSPSSKKVERGLSILVSGPTGTGKSTAMLEIARFFWEEYGRECIAFGTEAQKTTNEANDYADIFPDFPLYSIELIPKRHLWGRLDHLVEEVDKLNKLLLSKPNMKLTIIVDSATDIWEDLLDWMRYDKSIQRQKEKRKTPEGKILEYWSAMPTEWRRARRKFADLIKNVTTSKNIIFLYSARPKKDKDGNIIGPQLDSRDYGLHHASLIFEGILKKGGKKKGRWWTLTKMAFLAKSKTGKLVGWSASKQVKSRGFLNFRKMEKMCEASMGIKLRDFFTKEGAFESTQEEKDEDKTKNDKHKNTDTSEQPQV